MKEKSKKYLGAIIPALLLWSPAFASSARSISRLRGKKLAVQSEAVADGMECTAMSDTSDPFSVFGSTLPFPEVTPENSGSEVLAFLENNGLLRANGEAVSQVSGELDDVLGRKDFAHASAYNHCHLSWGTYFTNTTTWYGTQIACENGGGVWELGVTAPVFQTTSVGNKTATSFDVNVDMNQASTVYAVLVLSTAQAPNSTQVRNGQDGSGAAAIQTKSLVLNSGAFAGTISFSALTAGTKYLVYLVGQNAASELTPTPEVVNPGFVYGTLSSVGYWKFPKVRTDSNGNIYAMYWNSTVIQFVKWNGNSWDNYASITSSSVPGRTYISYGNEYRANFEFDSNNHLHVMFNASPDQWSVNYDAFLGVYNGSSWTINQIANDSAAPDEVRLFIDANNKNHVVYNVNYTLRYATDASGSWGAQTIVTTTGAGTDELHDDYVAVDSTGKVSLIYRREDLQNDSQDNYYLTSSADNFTSQSLILNGKGDGKIYRIGNVVVDSNNKLHYVYTNQTNATAFYRTDASGIWVSTALSAPSYSITSALGVAVNGSSTYILTNGANGYHFQVKEGGNPWTYGNPFTLNGFFSDRFALDTVSNRIMLASENSSDWTANYHGGEVDDYVTTAAPNTAPVNTVVPVVSGTNTVGSQLTATSGTWTDADGDTLTYTYQWYRADDNSGTNEAVISGATGSTYTLITSDSHKYLRVVVTANDGQGSADQTAASTRTAISNTAPVNTVVPAISGTSTVGSQLAATSGTWTDADGDSPTYTYQWYRADDNSGTNEAVISGATGSTYTLTTSDAHKYLRVVVTANDGHGSSDQTAASTRTAAANTAPVNTVVPAISGASTVGSLLTATSGTWTDADGDMPTYSYQWYRADDSSGTNETAIAGETSSSYTLTVSDIHKYLRVVVTANDGQGSSDQTAASTRTAVANTAPVNTVVPAISGTSTVGSQLTATSGTWTDADGDTPTYTYQWYRADDNSGTNEAVISGATGSTYILITSDAHKYLRVVVTANDGYGSSDQTAASTRTVIANTAPVNTVVPAISGTSTVGSQLAATSGTWTDADGDTPAYSYQWYRADDNSGTNEAVIAGETSSNYTLTASDAHKYLRVVVTANDGHGSSDQTAVSTRTAVANTAPVNTVVPAISGTNTVGSLLSASSGTWADADGDTPTYSYQWYRADDNSGTNEAAIAGETSSSYTLTVSDIHKYLRVVVTANDGQGSSDQTAVSAWTIAANTAPVNTVVPAISGASNVGSQLTSTSGTWTDADGDIPTYTYQWYRADDNSGTNEAVIAGETSNTYTLTVGDAHKYLRVVVTANDGYGSSDQTATSIRTAAANTAPVNTVVPAISGTGAVGSQLTSTSGTWTDADGDSPTYSYQWYRADDSDGTNDAAIPSATSNTYTLTTSDAHKYLRVVVTANDGHGSSDQTATSTRTAAANTAPVNTVVPAISGTSTVGSQITATSGTWTDADGDTPTYTYQWYRADDSSGTNEAAIAGETSSRYTLAASDAHKYLRVVVTANDGYGSSDQTAASTRTAVANTAPVNTVVPAISGTSTVGSQLTATSGTWTDTDGDTPTFSYQWYRSEDNSGTNEAVIAGETSSSYTLTASDAHKYLRVVVTANDGHGSSDQTATSTWTAAANSAPVNTVVPVISGTSTLGSQLTATSGTWTDADGDTPTYTYQWYRADDNSGTNEAVIAGETSSSYTLTASDAHKYLRVVVTVNDGHGSTDQTATSTWTAAADSVPVNTVVPVISGTSTLGSQLTATSGTWTDADGDTPTYTYQWYRADDDSGTNDTAIPAATSSSYTLTAGDAHKYLRVVVTANDGHGSSDQTATSTRTAVANTAPVNTVVPAISGTSTVGGTLAATSGTWTDADGDTPTYTYQWYRADDDSGTNEAAITGETSSNYTPTTNEAHKYISVVVTADDGHGSVDQTATSTRTVLANTAPVNTEVPAISGTNTVGGTLTATSGTWIDADGDTLTYTYQWKADSINIDGETLSTLVLTATQSKKTITCTITADDGHGGTPIITTNGVLVANSAPVFTGTPTITGNAKVGKTLALADTGTSDADEDTITLSYQWAADEIDIPGATLETYELTINEDKKNITCTLTADDGNSGITKYTTLGVNAKIGFPWWLLMPGLVSPNNVPR